MAGGETTKEKENLERYSDDAGDMADALPWVGGGEEEDRLWTVTA